jgi:site-specific recombinase XerD
LIFDASAFHTVFLPVEDLIMQLLRSNEAFLVTALTETGMRWGELAGLIPEQIEPETGWIRLWKTKNTNARSVPVSKATAERLKLMKLDGTMPNYSRFRDCLKRATKHAGLPSTFSVHALRHTTATRLIQKGVNLRIVQRYLGHKTIVTTTKYAHVQDDDLQSALEKISPRAGLEHINSYLVPEKVEGNQ